MHLDIYNYLNNLTEKEVLILSLYFVEDFNVEEISYILEEDTIYIQNRIDEITKEIDLLINGNFFSLKL
ncbi:MAG: hypothetical protein ACP5H3_02955 [Candidatus Aenigmatarchaeota archaeon]|jgi:DNA-directed RNA polymerase specialized sigma subunit